MLGDDATQQSGEQLAMMQDPTAFKAAERPEQGTRGRRIVAKVNFFELYSVAKARMWRYNINITPLVPPTLNRKIFAEFVLVCKSTMQMASEANDIMARDFGAVVFDGRHSVYSPVNIDLNKLAQVAGGQVSDDGVTFTVYVSDAFPIKHGSVLVGDGEGITSMYVQSPNFRKFELTLAFTESIDVKQLVDFLNGTAESRLLPPPSRAMAAFDVLMRHRPAMVMTSIGRSFFTRTDVKSVGDGAECWMGFH